MTEHWSSGDVSNILDQVRAAGPEHPEFAQGLAAIRGLACSPGPQASHYWRVADLATAGAMLCRLRTATVGRDSLPYIVAWWSTLRALGWESSPAGLLTGGTR
jgi:hypothetical protein